MELLEALEELSREVEAAAARGELKEAASLIARRATLIRRLAQHSGPSVLPRLEQIRAAGDRVRLLLYSQRARDAASLDRIRQVAATLPGASCKNSVIAIG